MQLFDKIKDGISFWVAPQNLFRPKKCTHLQARLLQRFNKLLVYFIADIVPGGNYLLSKLQCAPHVSLPPVEQWCPQAGSTPPIKSFESVVLLRLSAARLLQRGIHFRCPPFHGQSAENGLIDTSMEEDQQAVQAPY